jgi:hypothetical protein
MRKKYTELKSNQKDLTKKSVKDPSEYRLLYT